MEKKIPVFQKKKGLHTQKDTIRNIALSAIAATTVLSTHMAVASEAYTTSEALNPTATESSTTTRTDVFVETVLPTQEELALPQVLNLEPTQNNILFAAHYSHVSHASHTSHTSHYSCTPGATC